MALECKRISLETFIDMMMKGTELLLELMAILKDLIKKAMK